VDEKEVNVYGCTVRRLEEPEEEEEEMGAVEKEQGSV